MLAVVKAGVHQRIEGWVMTDNNSGEVIALQAGGDRQRDLHLPAFRAYWDSMRKMGDVPRRADIDPRGIEPLLENAMIIEKVAPGLARMRIAGTALSDLLGMEVRGMPLSALIDPQDRDTLADMLADLFERPATLDLSLKAETGLGRPVMNARLLLLPLRSDLGDISRALGCFVTNGMIGRTPRRFRIQNSEITPVALPAEGRLARGFEEAPAPFTAEIPEHRGERPYLRVVK